MKSPTALSLCLAALLCPAAPGEELVPLWPAGEVPSEPERMIEKWKPTTLDAQDKMRIAYVDAPEIEVRLAPEGKRNGAAVVICPGGGYHILAYSHEGTEIADWFNSFGVSAFVLKYRVPRRDAEVPHTQPLQDVQRAIRLVRAGADGWGVDPERVGVLGFSAGGHLTVMAGTHYGDETYDAVDDADALSARPDFIMPIYAAYLGDKETGGLSPLVAVDKATPPAFLAVTHDDATRGRDAALFYAELQRHGVTGEVHVYSRGGHGYGMRKSDNPVHTWPDRAREWMGAMGLLD